MSEFGNQAGMRVNNVTMPIYVVGFKGMLRCSVFCGSLISSSTSFS